MSPADATTDHAPSAALVAARADVGTVASALESAFRGTDYPRELDQVVAAFEDTDLALAAGSLLGGYRDGPDAVEFELCVEHESGAFATYDTALMSMRESGKSGGCPAW